MINRIYKVRAVSGKLVHVSKEEFIDFITSFDSALAFKNVYEYDRTLPFPRNRHYMEICDQYYNIFAWVEFYNYKEGNDD